MVNPPKKSSKISYFAYIYSRLNLYTDTSVPLSSLFSLPFLIAIIVFSFQIAIFSLVSVDVIDLSNSSNPFNIPTNVESTVRATQVLAIIIAIVTQDDVKKVILILRDGYNVDVFQGTFGPNATKFRYCHLCYGHQKAC